jgi:hypothetical protein
MWESSLGKENDHRWTYDFGVHSRCIYFRYRDFRFGQERRLKPFLIRLRPKIPVAPSKERSGRIPEILLPAL